MRNGKPVLTQKISARITTWPARSVRTSTIIFVMTEGNRITSGPKKNNRMDINRPSRYMAVQTAAAASIKQDAFINMMNQAAWKILLIFSLTFHRRNKHEKKECQSHSTDHSFLVDFSFWLFVLPSHYRIVFKLVFHIPARIHDTDYFHNPCIFIRNIKHVKLSCCIIRWKQFKCNVFINYP